MIADKVFCKEIKSQKMKSFKDVIDILENSVY